MTAGALLPALGGRGSAGRGGLPARLRRAQRLYHRYGFALNAAGIDLWAVDQFGHGMTPGERGNFGSIEDSSALAEGLTELAEQAHPGIRLWHRDIRSVRSSHCSGCLAQPRSINGVISGAPLVPVAAARQRLLVRPRPGLAVQRPVLPRCIGERPAGLRRRERHGADRELDHAWDRFGAELPGLTVPTLAVHGEDDPIAMIGAVRAYADEVPAAGTGIRRGPPRHPQRVGTSRGGSRDHRVHRSGRPHRGPMTSR
jgi:pimeloyl-ACP methyl ester carboxylesterase